MHEIGYKNCPLKIHYINRIDKVCLWGVERTVWRLTVWVLGQCLCCSVYVYPVNMDTISPVLIEGMILACTMTPSTQYDFGMHYAQSLSSLNSAWSGLSELDFDDSIHSVEFHASKILLLITGTWKSSWKSYTVPENHTSHLVPAVADTRADEYR